MKFKDFLKEKATYFRGIEELIGTARLPITSKVSKLLGYGSKKVTVQHCTTIGHLEDMKKLQNSKEQLSCFTHGLANLLDKIVVKPDVMFILEGNSVMDFKHDIFSHPDKFGRRWISTKGSPKSDFLQEAMLLKVCKQLIAWVDPKYDPYSLKDDEMLFGIMFRKLEKSQKTELIQMYFDKIHDMMSKPIYSKIVNEILSINKIDSKYDEILLNKFKIKGCYSLENGKYRFNHDSAKEDIELKGIKYLGHLSQSDFMKY